MLPALPVWLDIILPPCLTVLHVLKDVLLAIVPTLVLPVPLDFIGMLILKQIKENVKDVKVHALIVVIQLLIA